MKFEKVNKDKMRVTLSRDDLEANDIDFHSFMSDSHETETLFLAVLDKAEQDYGFSTDNYKLKVETFALDNGNFILTITRSRDSIANSGDIKNPTKKRFRVSRKVPTEVSESLAYKFNNFDDFCSFAKFLTTAQIKNIDKMAKTSMLYSYNGNYYWVLNNINPKYTYLKNVYSAVTEFGAYASCANSFIAKLHENGSLIIKANAVKVCTKYFV